MPIPNENPMQDAPAGLDTGYCFVPDANGSFNAASRNNTFDGSIGHSRDEDWIIIELKAGVTYEFTVKGRDTDATMEGDQGHLEDPVLKLLDGKGGLIDENDDAMPGTGDLSSKVTITASQSGIHYISVSAYTGNPGQQYSGAYQVMVRELTSDIDGTDKSDKLIGTDIGEKISGERGNDVLDGRGGDDRLDGDAGNDLLTGGPGADVLNGGGGEDTISYRHSAMGESVTINLNSGTARGGDAEGDTLGSDIENVAGAMYAENMLTGDRGNNKLIGGMRADVLIGGRSDDELNGLGGDDELEGGEDDDTLEGGAGADMLTGGEGDDTASYAGSMMGVTVRLHASQAMGGDAEGDTFVDMVTVEYDNPDPDADDDEKVLEETVPDIINLTGSHMADVLAGDSRANAIMGMGGDDKLYGGPGGGDDVLMGGGGNDMLFGGIGDDELHGGDGDDVLNGGAGDDAYDGGAGDDTIHADSDDFGVAVAATTTTPLNGIDGGAGMDTISFEKLEKAVIFSLGATSSITNAPTSAQASNVENIIGTGEDDILIGSDENNIIEGGDNGDMLDGGATSTGDTVSYRSSDRGVNVTLGAAGAQTNPSGGHASGDAISNFENVIGSAHSDNLTGNAGNNVLTGLGDDDELIGGEGDDTLEGGAGADELDGDNGNATQTRSANDTLSYMSSDAGVSVNLATASASGGHATGDEIETQRGVDHDSDATTDPIDVATFENVTGSMYSDRLTGDHRDNKLDGGAGDDTLKGAGGADKLTGGPGADMLDGGSSLSAGADTPDNTADDVQHVDWAVYRTMKASSGMDLMPGMDGVTVNLADGKGTAGDAAGDSLVDIELVWGSKGDDIFIASAGVDMIHGDTGSDTISYEESGSAVTVNLATDQPSAEFDGDPSDDLSDLGTAIAVVANGANSGEDNAAAGDRIGGFENVIGSAYNDAITGNSVATATDPSNANGETAPTTNKLDGGAGNDVITGGAGNDMLMGGSGRDTLIGGDGGDTLTGGSGDDDLTGGSGADTFVFTAEDKSDVDTILGFSHTGDGGSAEGDMINLKAFDIDEDELAGVISARGTGDNARVVIDLSSFGGGDIVLDGLTSTTGLLTADGDLVDGVFIL